MADFGIADVTQQLGSDGTARVLVSGEIDVSTAPQMTESVLALLDQGARAIEIDLSAVTFMDSSGLNGLVRAGSHAQERAVELVLVDPTPRVFKTMEITGINRILTVRRAVPA